MNATSTNVAANAAGELLCWQRDREQHHERHDSCEHRRLCEHERRPIGTAFATTVEPRLPLFHYNLAGAELGTQTKIRFQATGYAATARLATAHQH